MSELDKLVDWRVDNKPPGMTKTFSFESYEKIRSFMNDLADLSEETEYYPNLTYTSSRATVSIYTDGEEFSANEIEFAIRTDKIAELYCE